MCAIKTQSFDKSLPACITALRTLHDLPSYYELYPTNYVIQRFDSNDQPWRMIVVVVSILIVVFTILGNSLICIAALLDYHLRHRSNVLFVSLAVTNLLFACVVMIFNVIYNIINPTKFTDITVTLFLSLDKCFCTITILHLVAIAFDRFVHIQAPLKYSRKLTPRLLAVIILSLWSTSALITFLPIQLSWHKEYSKAHSNQSIVDNEPRNYTEIINPDESKENLTCYHKIDRAYALTNAILSFFVPLILMILIYTRLFLLTKQHISQINSYHQTIIIQDSLTDCRRYKSFQALETTLTPSSETNSNKRKSLSSLKAGFYLEPGDDFLTINHKPESIATLLNVSADTLKLRSRLSKSTVSSCRSVEVCKPESLLSAKSAGTTNSSVTCVRTQRMHSLPGIRVSIRRNPLPRGLERLQSFGSDGQLQKAHKAAITLGVILGSFTICWLPYFVINCVASFCDCIPKDTIFAVTWLGYFNACLNPVVYSLLNNKFRQSCKKLLCAWRYNRERKVQYGLDKLRHFGDATIHLAIGKVPWNKDLKPTNTNGFPS